MKRRYLVLLSLLCLTLVACKDANSPSKPPSSLDPAVEQRYLDAVSQFPELKVGEVKAKQEKGETFYLYMGRVTCPHCREFVPQLVEASKGMSYPIYYLNSIGSLVNSPDDLRQFRNSYNLKTVPALLLFKGDLLVTELNMEAVKKSDDIKQYFQETWEIAQKQ